jgi:hypothetical protein
MRRLENYDVEIFDDFSDPQLPGRVIGQTGNNGILRMGMDTEGIISIDHGALRIGYPSKPGWRRHGLAYGLFHPQNGLTFAVMLINGHNSSQTDNSEALVRRVIRYVSHKLLGWINPKRLPHKIKPKIHFPQPHYYNLPHLDLNLAVGWFKSEAPSQPKRQGGNFLIKATGEENGELLAKIGSKNVSVIRGIQNITMYYIIVLRETGLVYYIASLDQVRGVPSFPYMKPVGVNFRKLPANLFSAVYQSILGEIGFRIDTRINAARVTKVSHLQNWYGTAHAADKLIEKKLQHGDSAEVGGKWRITDKPLKKTVEPPKKSEGKIIYLYPASPSGLVHIKINFSSLQKQTGIVWRLEDKENFWLILFCVEETRLLFVQDGEFQEIANSKFLKCKYNTSYSAQVIDDGDSFSLLLNGNLVFDKKFYDKRLKDSKGVGVYSSDFNDSDSFTHFEAHPRTVLIPSELKLPEPYIPHDSVIEVVDYFKGRSGNLDNRIINNGTIKWRKELGKGRIALSGIGTAKVQASVDKPNPGRTAYTIPWEFPKFADLEVEILPPGNGKGQGEKGRGGLIYWQDENNYIIISTFLDDWVVGKAIATFFYIDGFDDLYRAVWSNISNRIHWGIPYKLRTIFDGTEWLVFLNGEAIIFRSLTDVYPDRKNFIINRVGIVANWEFGDDTGSEFISFIAKKIK